MEKYKIVECLSEIEESLYEELANRCTTSPEYLRQHRNIFDIDAHILYTIAEIIANRLGYPIDYCLEELQEANLNLEGFYGT